MKRLFPLSLLLPALLLGACTGTEDETPAVRLAVLTDGGSTVRTVTVGGTTSTPLPEDVTVTVGTATALDTLPEGNRLALTLPGGIESRDIAVADARAFAPPFQATGFTPPCLRNTVLNAQGDRLLTLSQCEAVGGPQQLALYRPNGTLVWRAALRTFTPPPAGADVPPLRLALVREGGVDVAVVARPALAGGSEVLRAAALTTGTDRATASEPVPTPAIRDLAPAAGGSVVYAATDTGVQPLTGAGTPDATATLTAFGTERVDRLWTSAGSGIGGTLIAAWRDPGTGGSAPLRLWDSAARVSTPTAATVDSIAELRDVTFAPDGNLYALTRTALTGYDTLFGLNQGNWGATNRLSGLNDARAVTWLLP